MDIEALIGIGAAPGIIYFLTSHIKQFVHARQDRGGSYWPLVADGVGAGYGLFAWYDGNLGDIGPLSAVLAGIAISIAAQRAYDQFGEKK